MHRSERGWPAPSTCTYICAQPGDEYECIAGNEMKTASGIYNTANAEHCTICLWFSIQPATRKKDMEYIENMLKGGCYKHHKTPNLGPDYVCGRVIQKTHDPCPKKSL